MSKPLSSLISSLFGKFASTEFPQPIQKKINSTYVKLLKLDMSEFLSPNEYSSLNKLFTRELKIKREFSEDKNILISPCDSLVTIFGEIKKDLAMQIKRCYYTIDELLDGIDTKKIESLYGGEFVNLYLSPKDYHRYHSPCDLKINKLIHIPGKLYPVNIPALKFIPDLFIKNERVILECEDNKGDLFILVFVGALNVGEMVFNFEPTVQTNSSQEKKIIDYKDLNLKKGDEIGYFKMGSTVLMFSKNNSYKYNLLLNQKVKFAQNIGISLK